ncbi:DUF2332 domain-containing protein [Haloplanus sp. C73]|uniref:DUF2332 domain-containing protein n=1 Tax=Haloplanus sp. C73 TaxID=3421641 RepID=UPI003EC10A00
MYLSEQFETFAGWCSSGAPLYERLARITARHRELISLAATAPEGRAVPPLFLASVHAPLLDGVEHPLREYYPSCVDTPKQPDDDLSPVFRHFCRTYRDRIEDHLQTRRVQTNEIGRCAVLYPALAHVTRLVDGPLALVDVGASTGLNLLVDEYAYQYPDYGRYGADDSPVMITTTVRDDGFPPALERGDEPAIASRVGIDIDPPALDDEADRRWLRALFWPEHQRRRERFENAVDVWRKRRPRVVEGDAIETLPDVVASIPDERPVCVVNTQALYQFDEAASERFRSTLREVAADRTLHWLSGETQTPTTEAPTMRHARVSADSESVELDSLATYHAHGRWLRWDADA